MNNIQSKIEYLLYKKTEAMGSDAMALLLTNNPVGGMKQTRLRKCVYYFLKEDYFLSSDSLVVSDDLH